MHHIIQSDNSLDVSVSVSAKQNNSPYNMSTTSDDYLHSSTKQDFLQDHIIVANGSNDSDDDEITTPPHHHHTPLQRSIEIACTDPANEVSETIPSMLNNNNNNNTTDDTTKQQQEGHVKPCSRRRNVRHRSNNNRSGTADCTDAHTTNESNELNDGSDDDDDDDDDDDYEALRSSSVTIEASNQRGRSRNRRLHRKGERRHRQQLRSKFVIESLYVEISELRKQNEVLRRIWDDVQHRPRGMDAKKLTTFQQHREGVVPCAVVRVSSGSVGDDDDALGSSDLEDGVGEGEEFKTERRTSKYDTTEEDDAEVMQLDFERLFYS
mmetsp:Transcript_15578/g.33556  ORF Transcript_15578/g.33556 Transcript_15578/m.33556 type:complete len:323 (-) Transcript_15578:197-1165(-)